MQELKIQFTDKEITPWGGMILLKKMLEKIDFKGIVETCKEIPQPGSNRGYKPYTIVESFITSVLVRCKSFYSYRGRPAG